jgi:hypothetical protein
VADNCKHITEVPDSLKGNIILRLSLCISWQYVGERNYILLIPTLGNKWRWGSGSRFSHYNLMGSLFIHQIRSPVDHGTCPNPLEPCRVPRFCVSQNQSICWPSIWVLPFQARLRTM